MKAISNTLTFILAGWPMRIVAAFALIALGGAAYMFALISIIGIPFAFALLFLPAAASLYIASELIHQASRLARPGKPIKRVYAAYAAAVASFMVGLGVNASIASSARALTANDFYTAGDAPIRKLGLAVEQLHIDERFGEKRLPACDALCLRLLISGAVQEVIMTGPVDPSSGPRPEATALAAKFVKRGDCATKFYFPSWPRHSTPKKAYIPDYDAYEEARQRQERGHCLVETRTKLGAADAVVAAMETNKGMSPAAAGFDLFADTRSATQVSLYRRAGGRFEERGRKTAVSYQKLAVFAAPTYLHGYAYDLEVGFARWPSYVNAGGSLYGSQPQAAFVTGVMGLDLTPPAQ